MQIHQRHIHHDYKAEKISFHLFDFLYRRARGYYFFFVSFHIFLLRLSILFLLTIGQLEHCHPKARCQIILMILDDLIFLGRHSSYVQFSYHTVCASSVYPIASPRKHSNQFTSIGLFVQIFTKSVSDFKWQLIGQLSFENVRIVNLSGGCWTMYGYWLCYRSFR